MPDAILEQVVIVAVPTHAFADFAQQLGVTGEGGLRTISAYDLSPLKRDSLRTVRSGFI